MRERVLAQLVKISGCEDPRLEDGVVPVPIFLFDPKGNCIYAVLPST